MKVMILINLICLVVLFSTDTIQTEFVVTNQIRETPVSEDRLQWVFRNRIPSSFKSYNKDFLLNSFLKTTPIKSNEILSNINNAQSPS